RPQPLLRGSAPTGSLGRMEHQKHAASGADADLSLEGQPPDAAVRLPGLERRPRPQRPRKSEPKSPTVSATLRHRNELPAKKPSSGPDDKHGPDLPSVAGRNRLPAPPSLGDADGNPGAAVACSAQRLDRRIDPRSEERRVG